MIHARVNALLLHPTSSHTSLMTDFNDVTHYTGPVFTDITTEHVHSNTNAPDVNGFLSGKGITHSLPDNFPLSQDDIDAIAKYACVQGILAGGKPHIVNRQKPTAGTWPNWPDLEWNGETITCFAKGTRKRMNAAPQTPTTTAKTKQSAAAKRAAAFGKFTLG